MTAIFAYAAKNIAFVAGDTCRTSKANLQYEACKMYPWSEHVLLAQAGEAEFLTDLICRLIARVSPLASTKFGFITNFQQIHDRFWRRAQKRYGGNSPAGTVLIASASIGGTPATIDKIDFETGIVTPITALVSAHGSLPAQFQNQAAALLSTHTSSAGVQLDNWALDCVDYAIRAHPATINWPADLLITRPIVNGRLIAKVRIATPASPGDPMFLA
jgi:hypothetical protein